MSPDFEGGLLWGYNGFIGIQDHRIGASWAFLLGLLGPAWGFLDFLGLLRAFWTFFGLLLRAFLWGLLGPY